MFENISISNRLHQAEHFMFDFETLGLDPDVNPIIEIGIVNFSLRHEDAVKTKQHFVQAVKYMPTRAMDDATVKWHMADVERMAHYQRLMLYGIDPIVAFSGAVAFVQERTMGNKEGYFWSKPAQFDWPFWCSHLEEFHLTNPFHRRNVIDVRSFVSGLSMFHQQASEFNEDSFKVGSHKAVEDAAMQVELVLKALGYIC